MLKIKEIEVALYDHDSDADDEGIETDVWLSIEGWSQVLNVDNARWLADAVLEVADEVEKEASRP